MENFSIDNDALTSYLQLFKPDIEYQIVDLYNEDFVVVIGEKSWSFVFLEKSVIILFIINGSIKDMFPMNYDYFISDELFKDIENLSFIPSRIRRYQELGVKRFKAEIMEQLQLGNIYTNSEGTTAIWNDYNLKFRFDSLFRLANIFI
ncbi:hypothetical protein AF332_20490 [Sporosarcina globispora]|uniref:Uncharacterized protein n=1 Tax=Sporosarcina globispora TaxID=1459 RepID=A0A0M0GHH3_SPOGL|nr:hypothetical protein [Sporosarcina globispora]KON88932.1 hypothetical protein AF332_20490 [Sporosarcina globispora]